MDVNFIKKRLEALSKEQLINIITKQGNRQYFEGLFREDLDKQTKENLITTILRFPNVHTDNNILSDFHHQGHIEVFRKLFGLAYNSFKLREAALNSFDHEKLIAILASPQNLILFKGYDLKGFLSWTREELIKFIIKFPEAIVDNTGRSFDPTHWKARPHQMDHIERIVAGFKDPTNEARVVWDGSRQGLGKTVASTLVAINLGIRYVLVVCPDPVIEKWHAALSPLGLFDYKICTYNGIKGTMPNEPVQWAKCKPDPNKPKYSEEFNWVRITQTGQGGKNSHHYDWSQLPDTDENGLGGVLVIWDEVQNAKGLDSKIGVCFSNFIYYLHKEPKKYVKCLMVSGGIMEKTDDLPYLMYAYGYILNPAKAELNAFIRERLIPNYHTLMGADWNPQAEANEDGHQKLLRFIRKVIGKQNRFSQISEPLPYILYKMDLIAAPELYLKTKYAEEVLIPNFRQYIGDANWKEEYTLLEEPDEYLKVFLSILANDPTYAKYPIKEVLNSLFPNPITFQAIQIKDEEIDMFRHFQNEISTLLEAVARGDLKFNQGVLGAIQRALSNLENLKLVPFTETARAALMTHYENGARGSVVIGWTRNASVRYTMWRMEAILWLEDFYAKPYPNAQARDLALIDELTTMIAAILKEQIDYAKIEAQLIRDRFPLKLKSGFKKLNEAQLRALSPEDIVFEYNKWIKYLYLVTFKFVCIYVGDIGDPNPSKFDISSPEPEDWIKESVPMDGKLKTEMKHLFFKTNSRRVFITNIQTAKEGIDLHDTSDGGLHPRTMILSPGIIARYIDQFLARVVRDGQTSNAVRIVGYIDNFKNEASWEARFMPKLNKKLKDIQQLHNGEVKLDIEENVDNDGSSVLQQIIEDLRNGKPYKNGGDPNIPVHGNVAFQDDVGVTGASSRPVGLVAVSNNPNFVPAVQIDAVKNYFRKNYQGSEKSPTEGREAHIQVPILQQPTGQNLVSPLTDPMINIQPAATLKKVTLSKIIIRNNDNYFFFDTQYNENPGNVDARIMAVLARQGVNNKYYIQVAPLANNLNNKNGILVYRPGLVEDGISQPDLVKNIVEATALEPEIDVVGENDLDFFRFKPVIGELIKIIIMFDSPTEMRVTPKTPLQSKFPQALLAQSLTMDTSDQNSLIFRGTGPRIIAAYYAIRAIIKFEAVTLFDQNITVIDPNKVLVGNKYLLANVVFDGVYVIMADKEEVLLMDAILKTISALQPDIEAGKIFGAYDESNNFARVVLNNPYQSILNIIIGFEPGIIANGKVVQEQRPK